MVEMLLPRVVEFLERAAGRFQPSRNQAFGQTADPAVPPRGETGATRTASRKRGKLPHHAPTEHRERRHTAGTSSMKKPLALLSALLLSACVSAPTTTPQASEIAPQSLGLSGDAAPQFPDEWWKAFNDPQVDRLAALVLSGNPTLQGALARIRAAQAQLSGARADDLPQVTLDGQEQRAAVQQGLHYSAALRRHLSMVWPGRRQSQLESGFLGQAGGDHRPRQGQRPGGGAGCGGGAAGVGGRVGPDLHQSDARLSGYRHRRRRRWPSARKFSKLTQGRFNAGLENASAVEQAKALLALARVDVKRTAAAARHGRPCHRGADGAGRGSLCDHHPAHAQSRHGACRLPDSACRPIFWRAGPTSWRRRRGWRRRPRAARPRMPISIPISI